MKNINKINLSKNILNNIYYVPSHIIYLNIAVLFCIYNFLYLFNKIINLFVSLFY